MTDHIRKVGRDYPSVNLLRASVSQLGWATSSTLTGTKEHLPDGMRGNASSFCELQRLASVIHFAIPSPPRNLASQHANPALTNA
jgi:hypothetical protein